MDNNDKEKQELLTLCRFLWQMVDVNKLPIGGPAAKKIVELVNKYNLDNTQKREIENA